MTGFVKKIKRILLLAGDIAILYFALWLTLRMRYGIAQLPRQWELHFVPFTIVFAVWVIVFYILGLYDLNIAKNTSQFFKILYKAAIVNAALALLFFYLIPYFGITPRANLIIVIALVGMLMFLWRRVYNSFVRLPLAANNVVFVGKNKESIALAEAINRNPQLGYRVLGTIEPEDEQFRKVVQEAPINTLISVVNLKQSPEFAKFLYKQLPKLNVKEFNTFYEELRGKISVSEIDEIWFLANLQEENKALYDAAKRLFDIIAGLALIALVVVLYVLIAFAIKFDSAGPVFYKQKRVGKNGKIFRIVKFRSMVQDAEQNGAEWATKKDPRTTRVGKILRKTLLDELPQGINILKGEMSLIGPRPERPEFVKKLKKEIPYYDIRHIVKPGLTGWAQVKFKYGNTKEDALKKLQYELYYIKNRSIFLDLKIILKTIDIILKGGTQ